MNQVEKTFVSNKSVERLILVSKGMIVVSPTHFILPPVELHITAAGRSIIRANTVRARRLYCRLSHDCNQIIV